jgi:hypothetical protein
VAVIDMMDRLALSDQGRDQRIQCKDLLFGKRDSASGFGKVSKVFLMGFRWVIEMFFPGASGRPVPAAVADIRWFFEDPAYSRFIVITVKVAFHTEATPINTAFVRAVAANVGTRTGHAVCAVIETMSPAPHLDKGIIPLHLLRNGRAVFMDHACDCIKGK